MTEEACDMFATQMESEMQPTILAVGRGAPLPVAIPPNGLHIDASPEQPWRFYGLFIDASREHTAWVTVTRPDGQYGSDEETGEPIVAILRTMCPAGSFVQSTMPLACPEFSYPVVFRLEGEGCSAFVTVAPR